MVDRTFFLYRYSNQHDKALKDYSKVIELDPKDARLYSSRGGLYKDMKQLEKSIADYTKAIELSGGKPYYYRVRGRAYFDLKDYEKAIADYTKSIEFEPNKNGIMDAMRIVLLKSKNDIQDWD